ncbi:hypothetical protein ACFWIQ_36335 [Kitasatospora sp. NPDC127059]
MAEHQAPPEVEEREPAPVVSLHGYRQRRPLRRVARPGGGGAAV